MLSSRLFSSQLKFSKGHSVKLCKGSLNNLVRAVGSFKYPQRSFSMIQVSGNQRAQKTPQSALWGHLKIARAFASQHKSTIDHYSILGLSKHRKDLTLEILTSKFKELSLKYHPDLNPGKNTNEMYMQIKDSYEHLRHELFKNKKGGSKNAQSEDHDFEGATKESSFRYYQRQAYNNTGTRSSSSNWDFKTEEEYIFYLVFGYNWDEDVDRFMLTQHAEKRKIFMEKVIELRKTKFEQEAKTSQKPLTPPKDNFGEGLNARDFIQSAFKTRFTGLGSRKKSENTQQEDSALRYLLVACILAGIGFVGYTTATSVSKKVLSPLPIIIF